MDGTIRRYILLSALGKSFHSCCFAVETLIWNLADGFKVH